MMELVIRLRFKDGHMSMTTEANEFNSSLSDRELTAMVITNFAHMIQQMGGTTNDSPEHKGGDPT